MKTNNKIKENYLELIKAEMRAANVEGRFEPVQYTKRRCGVVECANYSNVAKGRNWKNTYRNFLVYLDLLQARGGRG